MKNHFWELRAMMVKNLPLPDGMHVGFYKTKKKAKLAKKAYKNEPTVTTSAFYFVKHRFTD